jgi:hypothetical protein
VIHVGKMTTVQRKCKGVNSKLMLKPYSAGCPGGGTPHHLIPDRCASGVKSGYSHGSAPCICVQGSNQHSDEHKKCHRIFDPVERWHAKNNKDFTYSKAKNAAAKSAGGALNPARRLSKREQECIKAQLDEYYKKKPEPDFQENTNLNATGGGGGRGKVNELFPQVEAKTGKVVELFS